MRVIGGRARGTKLKSPSTEETVPITDRAKEALFNIIMPKIYDCNFLDLFAGTGGVGIEALSRGANSATFLEISKAIFGDLTWNIERTRFKEKSTILNYDAFKFLQEDKHKYDIIFVAPPQWKNMCQEAMDTLCKNLRILAEDGIVITQHDPTEPVKVNPNLLTEYDKRVYGGVQFNFFKRQTNKNTQM